MIFNQYFILKFIIFLKFCTDFDFALFPVTTQLLSN